MVAGKLPIGVESLLAKYEIVDWLGEGGMGVVFLVRHRLLGERRVIKMIHPERAQEPEFRDRFLHEARTAIRYRHPNIAQVFDFNADEGPTYLVMEYIDGIRSRTFSERTARSMRISRWQSAFRCFKLSGSFTGRA